MSDHQTKAWGDSDTKFFYQLTPEKILESVEDFGLQCTGRCNALNSMENRVYDIELLDEDDNDKHVNVIAKFYRPGRWSKQQILEEHNFLQSLVDVEVPVVSPIAHRSSQETLLKMQDSEIYFALFPKIGGRSPDELSNEEYIMVGRLIGRMHNVGQTLNADHRVRISPESYGTSYLSFFENSDCVPPEYKTPLCQLVEAIANASEPIFSQVKTHAIHGDAHLGNLLNGREGFFWVDFDDMVVGPAVQDLWLILSGRDEFAKTQLRHLLEGYQTMRPFDHNELRLIEPLRALRMIHFAAWIGIRWQDPAFQRAFPFYRESLYWNNLCRDLGEQLQFIQQGMSSPFWTIYS